jgi:hypothetical protein
VIHRVYFLEGLIVFFALFIPLVLGSLYVDAWVTETEDAFVVGVAATTTSILSCLYVALKVQEWYDRTDEEE